MSKLPLQGRQWRLTLGGPGLGGHKGIVPIAQVRELCLLLANDDVEDTPKWLEIFAEQFRKWLTQLYRDGSTKEIVSDLNQGLIGLRVFCFLESELDADQIEWRFVPATDEADPRGLAALRFGQLLTEGALDGLKRCSLPECNKFYVGGPRAKYCSDSCGSLTRVRRKRKRDRERQML